MAKAWEPGPGPPGQTIAAVSTPLGPGGIGVIRISGPQAWPIGLKVFKPRRAFSGPPPLRRMILGTALDPISGEALDEVLGVFFQAPNSYTTENTVEIQSHSGPAVMGGILEAILGQGAVLAQPGEFTLRAMLGGRLDLSQAEAVAQLIAARSEQEAGLALAGLQGALARELVPVRQALTAAAAAMEAAMDFPDEVAEIAGPDLAQDLAQGALAGLESLVSAGRRRQVFRQGAVVTLCGRPNVGKSSLFNALLGRHRAIITPQPGTTRDFIEETCLLGSVACRLVDTAGLGLDPDQGRLDPQADDLGMAAARQVMGRADLNLVVLDGSEPLDQRDRLVLEETKGRPRVVAVNKADLAQAWQAAGQGLEGALAVSALSGQGLGDLAEALARQVTRGEPEPVAGEALASVRQTQALERCLAAARRAAQGLQGPDPQPEIISLELAEALAALGEVDGQGAPDQVIEAVFSQFCVGK